MTSQPLRRARHIRLGRSSREAALRPRTSGSPPVLTTSETECRDRSASRYGRGRTFSFAAPLASPGFGVDSPTLRRNAGNEMVVGSCWLKSKTRPWRTILDLEKIVGELERERDRLNQVIAVLKQRNSPASAKTAAGNGTGSVARRGRRLTAAGRKRLSELMKKRWAERRRKAKSS
jgi:hypothetical protein